MGTLFSFHQKMLRLVLILLLVQFSDVLCGDECVIKDEKSNVTETSRDHEIVIQCGEHSVIQFTIKDNDTSSYLRLDDIRDEVKTEWLVVDFTAGSGGRGDASSSDMFITIEGARYNVRDDKEQEEHQKLLQLFAEPDFKYFTVSTKLIHDELQLKGWESPSVMVLYTLALAAESQADAVEKRHYILDIGGIIADSVDDHTYWYHGKYATKECRGNGWNTRYLRTLQRRDCEGICGPSCHTCWEYICGDCCFHKGCKRHDKFCKADGYFSWDCLSVRGTLWDTLTSNKYDC